MANIYEFQVEHYLQWPSLTADWLPNNDDGESLQESNRIVLGTYSKSTENHILIANVNLSEYPDDDCSSIDSDCSVLFEFEIEKRLAHDGEVNRARHMPQNQHIIATQSPNNIFIYDTTKPENVPQLRLKGQKEEAFGLSWNSNTTDIILSASSDTNIYLWNLNDTPKEKKTIYPFAVFSGHTAQCKDAAWNLNNNFMFASVDADGNLMYWDMRVSKQIQATRAHNADANCVSFNGYSDYILLTGSVDRTVALWDLRNLNTKLHSFNAHSDEISQVQWSPQFEAIMASSGKDGRVIIWDLSLIGNERTIENNPPEMIFTHAHDQAISDFSWSPNQPWVICSVAQDHLMQIWKIGSSLFEDDVDVFTREL